MDSCGKSMKFPHFPREIRDLVYSVIASRDETYTIFSLSKNSLPRVVFNARPDLGILWTSKAVQFEFLEILCAINIFSFPFPNAEPIRLVQPLKQYQANLLQRVEIDFDLIVNVSLALQMFNREKIKRKTCRMTIRNEDALIFPLIPHGIFEAVEPVVGFETVTVVRKFMWDTNDAAMFQWYMEVVLGPSSIHHEEAAVCYEFHPREFQPKRWW